jgi:hypothetical protein
LSTNQFRQLFESSASGSPLLSGGLAELRCQRRSACTRARSGANAGAGTRASTRSSL